SIVSLRIGAGLGPRSVTEAAGALTGRGSTLAPMDEPRLIGRYRVLAELGRGGMGTVYQAFDPELQREVAIKVPHEGGDHVAAERFEREARAVARLRHPAIVPVFAVERLPDGRPFLVMELVAGRSIDRLWRAAPPDPWVAAGVLERAARGIAHAHEQGVLHRDLKPDNIIIDGKT